MTRQQLERLTLALPGRIYLSRLTASGRDEFLSAARASIDLTRPWMFPPTDEAAYAEYLARSRKRNMEYFLVREKEGGHLRGLVNVRHIVRGNLCSAFCGYYAFAGGEGRGLMREGVGMVLWLCFTHLGLHRVEINIQPDNLRSIALARRVGAEREGFSAAFTRVDGQWRDHERWAVRAETFPGLEKAMGVEGRDEG